MTNLPAWDDLVCQYATLAQSYFEADATDDEVTIEEIEYKLDRLWSFMDEPTKVAARKVWLEAKAKAYSNPTTKPGKET